MSERFDPALEALFQNGFPRAPVEELCASVERETSPFLARGETEAGLGRALELAERGVAQVQAQRVHLKTVPPPLACRAGCASCCFLRVEVSAAEAERLALRVLELGRVDQLRATQARVAHLNQQDRLRARIPCALLSEAGTCLAHDVRPFACRAANSMDAAACERHVTSAEVLGAIPIDPVPFALQRAAALGFRNACGALGMQAELGELHTWVVAALPEEP